MRVVAGPLDERGTHRILQQVSDDLTGRLGPSQYVIVVAALPQPLTGPLLPFERGSLHKRVRCGTRIFRPGSLYAAGDSRGATCAAW